MGASLHFTKMEGIGNDYIYVEEKDWAAAGSPDKPSLAKRLSDRHFGIGGDGVIFINPSEKADFEMEMYNADGSRGAMCGNGIRCVGKYVFDHGLTEKTSLSIESMGAVKYLNLQTEGNAVSSVTVNMGKPEILEEELDLEVQGKHYPMVSVSTGNPHAVTFVESVDAFPVTELGPFFENHPHFPDRTNTEFVEILDRGNIKMRVYERGSGETLACGTGACASVTAAVLKGHCDRETVVHLLGGKLKISWDEKSGHLFMEGPAKEVFSGEIFMG